MAGNGDFNRRDAWTVGTPTLTTGAHGTPPAQGDVLGDGGNPDLFLGSFTLQIVNPTLGVAAVASPTGNGDVGDIFGAPDTAVTIEADEGVVQTAGLIAFNTVAPALVPTGTAAPTGNGDLGDTGGPTVDGGQVNDSNAGFSTLTSFSSGSPTLGLGTVTLSGRKGDIDDVQGSDSGPIFQVVWDAAAPTLATQPTTAPVGQGDIPNPYSWQDSVSFLTSRIYPLLQIEQWTENGAFFAFPQFQMIEHFVAAGGFSGGTLTTNLLVYGNWPPENISVSAAFTGGTLPLSLVTYGNWPAENFSVSAGFSGGTIVLALVTYSNWPTEHIQSSGGFAGGTLT
jgi:hypothetical protein